MSCGKVPYYWECPDCGRTLTRQNATDSYATFYCDNCGLAFCIDYKGRYYDNEDDAGPLPIRRMSYIRITDICYKFNLNIKDFAFEEDFSNGDFIWFSCNENAREEYKENLEEYKGTDYEKHFRNTLMLANYLSEELGIADGIMLYMSW